MYCTSAAANASGGSIVNRDIIKIDDNITLTDFLINFISVTSYEYLDSFLCFIISY